MVGTDMFAIMGTNLQVMPPEVSDSRSLAKLRVAEALREVGILVVAFAPLDTLLSPTNLAATWPTVLGLIVEGCLVFALGVLGEVRFKNER